jgi:hypothetical protein
VVVVVTSIESKRFNPLSLDAVNFLAADVRGAVGPFLNDPWRRRPRGRHGLLHSDAGNRQTGIGIAEALNPQFAHRDIRS